MSAPLSRSPSQPLRLVYYAWLFGSFWANIAGGLALNRFARALGASDASFGLVSAIQNFGALVQIPVSYLVERNGRRKHWFLVGGILDRAMWVLIAAVPWVLPPRFCSSPRVRAWATTWHFCSPCRWGGCSIAAK